MAFWNANTPKRGRTRKIRNEARVYADANERRPRAYWDYDNFQIKWGCDALPRLWVVSV